VDGTLVQGVDGTQNAKSHTWGIPSTHKTTKAALGSLVRATFFYFTPDGDRHGHVQEVFMRS
jgi:hypothetical protein